MWWFMQAALAAPTLSEAYEAHANAHPSGEIGLCGPVSAAPPASWAPSLNLFQLTQLALKDDPRMSAGDFASWVQDEGGLRVDLPARVDPSTFYVGKFDASYFAPATSPMGPLKARGVLPDPEWRDETFEGGLRVSVEAPKGSGEPRALPAGVASGRAAGCLMRTAAGPWQGYFADPQGHRELWRLPPDDAPPHGVGEGPRFTPAPDAFEAFAVPVIVGADREERLDRWFYDPRWGHHFLTTNDAMGYVKDAWKWLGSPDITVAAGATVGEARWVLVRPVEGTKLPPGLEAPGSVVLLRDGWSTDWHARALPGGWVAVSDDAGLLARVAVGGRPWWEAPDAKAVFVAPEAFAGKPGFPGPSGRVEARADHWVSLLEGVDPTTR